jgi:hypothetical protein
MALLRCHIPYYVEIFDLPGFLAEPALIFGYQDAFGFRPTHLEEWSRMSIARKAKFVGLQVIERWQAITGQCHPDLHIPRAFKEKDLAAVLRHYRLSRVQVLDYFDPRADLKHDMNRPIPASWHAAFNTVIDIGSLEHVFDTRQCLENLFSMLKVGGHILLHTPCKGYFDHGLHTFSPECITQSLRLNGFDIRYLKYSTASGVPLEHPQAAQDVLLWVVAEKTDSPPAFSVPQQGKYATAYTELREVRQQPHAE